MYLLVLDYTDVYSDLYFVESHPPSPPGVCEGFLASPASVIPIVFAIKVREASFTHVLIRPIHSSRSMSVCHVHA